jgi:hypothetical protein
VLQAAAVAVAESAVNLAGPMDLSPAGVLDSESMTACMPEPLRHAAEAALARDEREVERMLKPLRGGDLLPSIDALSSVWVLRWGTRERALEMARRLCLMLASQL